MIAKLTGKLDLIHDNYAIVDVGGVGYKVFLSAYALGKVAGREALELFTHTYVREDALALYGFLSLDELDMFEMLISVSGIGPKAAMGILSIADVKTIRTAIANEDPSILTRVSGVGKKTAERVIIELRGKVGEMATHEKHKVAADADSLEALVALGYSASEARDALSHVGKDISDVAERVKAALKNLGRK